MMKSLFGENFLVRKKIKPMDWIRVVMMVVLVLTAVMVMVVTVPVIVRMAV